MKFLYSFFIFFALFKIYSESTKIPKKITPVDESKTFSLGVTILSNKTIETSLPFTSGIRRDLYDSNGNLLQSEYYDNKGNSIEFDSKTATEKRTYNSFNFLENVKTFDKKKKLSSHLKISYDENCLSLKKEETCVSEISLYDGAGKPIEDEAGVHKYQKEFDTNCLKQETKKVSDCKNLEIMLNKKLKPVEDKEGYAKVYKTFDEFGNLNLLETYDKFDKIKHKVIYAYNYDCIKLTNKPIGCIIFQEYSNQIQKDKINTNTLSYGKRILSYDMNCIKTKKNPEQCTSLEENYDINGKLKDTTQKFTFGCMDYSIELGAFAKKISNFDNNGNEITREFYNSNNQLIEDSSGVAKYVYTYNQECLDQKNKLQYCRTLSEIYDKNLKLKYKAIYDENCVKTGKAILESPNYCTTWKESYDSFLQDGNPKEKIRIIKASFDSNGFKTNLEQYDINRKLNIKTVFFFEKEKLIKKENQDINGNIIEDSDGIATYSYQYGNEIFTTLEETRDVKGDLKENPEGIARMVFTYDENCLEKKKSRYECTKLEEFYDGKGNLVEQKSNTENTRGYAKMVREFDNNGNLILKAFYNKKGKLKKNQIGIAKYKFFYDENGDLKTEEHYNKKNSLKQKILYTYDPACKIVSKDFICNTSITYLDKKDHLLDKEKLDDIPYAKEVTSYNQLCLKTILDPDECIEKKEYINSNKETVFAEYFQFTPVPNSQSEIKFIKLKLTQNKIPISIEFIK